MVLNIKKWDKRKKLKVFWLALFIIALVGTNAYVITQTPTWDFKHGGAFVLGNLCVVIAAAYLWFVYKASQAIPAFSEEKLARYYKRSMLILGLLLLIVPFFLMVHVSTNVAVVPDSAHNWDFFEIFDNTSYLHGRSFINLPATENQLYYFLRYPNNQFFGIVYNVLFAPFDVTAKIWVETALSAVLTTISVLSGSLIVRKIASDKLALFYNVVAFGFLPFYVYGAEFYTDTASLPFVIVSLLFIIYAIKAEKISRQILWWALASLLVFIGYNIKPTVAIPLIAAGAFLLLNRKWKRLLVMVPVAAVLFFGVHTAVKATIASEPAFSAENNNRYNLPLMHWITMSFAPENRYGGFNPAVLAYSESFPTVAAKQEADVKLFLSNLKKQGVGGFMLQIWRKILYTWFSGDLSDFFYTYRHENSFVFYFFDYTSLSNGSLIGPKEGNITGWLLLKAAQTLYWIPLALLMWYEIIRSLWKKRQSEWFILALSMVGLTVFLLIWEANARYLYNFAPIMVALAAMGLMDFRAGKKRKEAEAVNELSE